MAAPALRPLSTGEVLDTSFGLYRAQFLPLIIISLACKSAPLLLGIYLEQISGTSATAIFDHWQLFLVQFVLAILLNVVAVAATTFVVAGAYLGAPTTANDALGRAFRLFGPLALATIVSLFSIMIGFIALVVPGLILWSGLVLATAVIALEQPVTAMAALNRSWELTKGFRFKVFVAVLVAMLLFMIPAMVVGVVGAIGKLTGSWSSLISDILSSMLQVFVAPFMYVVITVLYYDLRVRKEGFDLELLATAAQPDA